MALKWRIAKLEDVPESLRGEYKAVDGGKGFELDLDLPRGMAVEDVGQLRTSLAETRRERDDFRRERDDVRGTFSKLTKDKDGKDLSLDEVTKLLERGRTNGDPAAHEARLQEIKRAHEQQIREREEQYNQLRGQYGEASVETALTASLSGRNAKVRWLMPHLKQIVRPVWDEKTRRFKPTVMMEDGKTPRPSLKPGVDADMSLSELIETLAKDPEWKDAFPGTGKEGPDAGGSGDGPPRNNNYRISASDASADPERYRQLSEAAAKAGTTVEVTA